MEHGFVRPLFAAAAFCIASPGIAADTLSWDNLSVAWIATASIDVGSPGDEDLKGYRLAGTAGITDILFVSALVNTYHVSDGNDFDVSTQQISAGARYSIPNVPFPLHIWGSLNYERISEGGEIGTGPGIDVGVRAMVYPGVDLGLTVKPWSDVGFDNFDVKYTGYELSAGYTFLPSTAFTLAWSNHSSDEGSYRIRYRNVIAMGLRYQYR